MYPKMQGLQGEINDRESKLWCIMTETFICLPFANGPGDLDSILGRVIPKTLKTVLDTSLLNTQQYKVRIKGKVDQSRKRISALPYTSV